MASTSSQIQTELVSNDEEAKIQPLTKIHKPSTSVDHIEADVSKSPSKTQCCSICLEDIHLKTITEPCFHSFCHICIFEWFKKKAICPVCRQKITKIMYNIRSDNEYNEYKFLSVLPNVSRQNLFNEVIRGSAHFSVHETIFDISSLDNFQQNQAFMMQILAFIYKENPDLKFPPVSVNYQTFSTCTEFSGEPSIVFDLFRCFIYLNNYTPVENFHMTREINIRFLQKNPLLMYRLLNFIREEIACLNKIFIFKLCPNVWLKLFEELLSMYDIRSKIFKQQLHSLLCSNGPFGSFLVSHDLFEKFYSEFIVFASSPFGEHKDFAKNVQYTWPESKDSNLLINKKNFSHNNDSKKPIEVITILSDSNRSSSEVEWIPPIEKEVLNSTHDSKDNANCSSVIMKSGPSTSTQGKSNLMNGDKMSPSTSSSKGPKTTFSYRRKDYMNMRRIIRNSQHSPYFYRKLLREVQKKFYNYDTILSTKHFSHLEDLFKDIFYNSKLYKTSRLSGESSDKKRALSYDDLQKMLNRSSRRDMSPDLNRKKGEQNYTSTDDSGDMSESAIRLIQYEEDHLSQINEDTIAHAMKPKKVSTKQFLTQMERQKIKYVNRCYTSSNES